jgi:Zn ribbon nucleic-acid-binding protein
MWKNTVEQATDDNVAHVHCMQCAYGFRHTHTHARAHTHTHTDYVLLIAFPLQQWLCERVH